MQRTVFLAMLKTQYQLASLMQMAGTGDSGARKSGQKFGGSFPHAEQCVFGPSRRLLAHAFLLLKSQIINLAGVSPMQSNVFWAC